MPVKSISAKQLAGAVDAVKKAVGDKAFAKLPPLTPSVGPKIGRAHV